MVSRLFLLFLSVKAEKKERLGNAEIAKKNK